MTTLTPSLHRFAQRVGRLYSLPKVALEVTEIAGRPTIDIRQLKECIERDPALVSKILRVVNSSLFGLRQQVSDLNQALALLGTKPLKMLVLGFSLANNTFAEVTGKAAQWYWRRALLQAVAARELAGLLRDDSGDEAFVAALLADIGMLVLIQEFDEPYADLVQQVISTHESLADLEVQSLGFSHDQLTLHLLDQWKLPSSLIHQVRLSRHPDQIELLPPAEQAAPTVLYLAQLLADILLGSQTLTLDTLLKMGAERLNLTKDGLAQLVGRVHEKIRPLADVFALTLPPGVDYRDVLLQAHRRLAQTAEEVLAEPSVEMTERRQNQIAELTNRAVRQAESGRPRAAKAPPKAPAKKSLPGLAIVSEQELLQRIQQRIIICRQARQPLTLVLVEIDAFDELTESCGEKESQRTVQWIHQLCQRIDGPEIDLFQFRAAGFAMLLADCDRRGAAQFANRLADRVRETPGSAKVSVSLGVSTVALPPKNFASQLLWDSATRCLSGAQLSGGGVVKSIEIY